MLFLKEICRTCEKWDHGPKSESSQCLRSAPNCSLKAISFPSQSWGQSFEMLRVRGKGNIELTSTEFQCGGRNILSYSGSLHGSPMCIRRGRRRPCYVTDRFKLSDKKQYKSCLCVCVWVCMCVYMVLCALVCAFCQFVLGWDTAVDIMCLSTHIWEGVCVDSLALYMHMCVFVWACTGVCWVSLITRMCGHLASWLKVCAL